jgi:tetratricopeptide (TPR) repeat protein
MAVTTKRQEEQKEDVSLLDRIRGRSYNAENLLKLVEKYEDKAPRFAFQLADKIMHEPKVFVKVPAGKHRLSGNDCEEYTVKMARSSNKKIAMMGLDWLAESSHDEWKSDYLKEYVIDHARNPEAKKRAWEMYSKARRGFWDQLYERADKRQAEAEELCKKGKFEDAVKLFEENIKFDENYTKAWVGKANALVAIGKRHAMLADRIQEAFLAKTISEERFSSDLKKHTTERGLAAANASTCYGTAIKILEEGKDISGVEYPNELIRSCEAKKWGIYSEF